MTTLVWSAGFIRAMQRATRRQPSLRSRTADTLRQLAVDPFHPGLHSHKLKGELAGVWACTVDYDTRILFEFVHNVQSGEDEIHLLTIGTHDEVY
jgi:addiction module RelE/StbE family toxin